MSQKIVRVAIGLVYQQGSLLVGWREQHLHQGGCYEFPGGKVEHDETPEQAVVRELKEETGLHVVIQRCFDEQYFEYPDRNVHLSFYLCKALNSLQGEFLQRWQWVALDHLKQLAFPAANQSILNRLAWTRSIAICTLPDHQPELGIDLCYLKQDFSDVLSIQNAIQNCLNQNIRPILNLKYYQKLDELWRQKVFAVHINGQQLLAGVTRDQGLNAKNMIAACHTQADVVQANLLGCDAIMLSPVNYTVSHPGQQGMGWEEFQKLAQQACMPVYALGGVSRLDVEHAIAKKGYGVAGIRQFLRN